MLFVKQTDSGGVTIFLLYVDYIIAMGDDEKEKKYLEQFSAKEFEIKRVGKAKVLSRNRSCML